jgi:2-C-methyl-D-erythritol 4-phosphate cytidylyltransferase
MSTWVIVVAGGTGTRFGGPKQLAALGDETVLARSVRVAASCADGVVVAAAAEHLDDTARVVAAVAPAATVVAGGGTRAGSVRNALAAVPAEATRVLVHDAARPLATPAIYAAVIEALDGGADAAVPGVPVVDTIRSLDGGVVDRDRLVAVQTPQGFRAAVLRAAHEGVPEATDDATLVERAGGSVVIVPGASTNLKITTPADLVIARVLAAAEVPS